MSSVRLGRPTGRNFTGGLPPSPRARSAGNYDVRERERETKEYKARTRDSDYSPRHNTGAPSTRHLPTRSVRSQRSGASLLPSRGRSSSRPDAPEVPPLPLPRRSDVSSKSSASSGSYSSTSGSSSAFLDRMKGRREYGYGSSRTSLEDEADPPPPPPKVRGPERGRWISQRADAETDMPESEYGETDDGNELPNQPGYGLSLWSRVATAASTLTISVSKAWTSNIAMYSGEHTPPGEESRLTRALKAYHIEKARDPTDLPPWLFEEHERRPLGGPGTRRRYREGSEYDHDSHRATAPPRSGGRSLRDIYDAAATTSVIPSRQQETREWSRRRLQDDAPVGPPPSKANDRLKALRDAKRNAAQRNAPVASMQSSHLTGDEGPVYEERGRGYGSDRGDGDGPRRIPPSLPASVRPLRSGVLPPRRTVRKI